MNKRCMGCMEQYDSGLEICPYCGYVEGTGAEDYANLDSVDISKLGEIGKKAYLVSQYEKEHGHTRGGKK